MGLCVRAVEAFQVGQIVLLRDAAQVRRWIEIGNAWFLRAHGGALVDGGQPSLGPVAHSEDGQSAWVGECDVSGEVLGLGAETVGEPASERWSAGEDAARLKCVDALSVVAYAGVHSSK
jgi:hypothetical protein